MLKVLHESQPLPRRSVRCKISKEYILQSGNSVLYTAIAHTLFLNFYTHLLSAYDGKYIIIVLPTQYLQTVHFFSRKILFCALTHTNVCATSEALSGSSALCCPQTNAFVWPHVLLFIQFVFIEKSNY